MMCQPVVKPCLNAVLCLCLTILALPHPVLAAESAEIPAAKPDEAGLDAELTRRLDLAVQKFVDEGEIAGAVVLVARRGKIVHEAAYGSRDLGGKQPMQRDSIFRIYSMSKAITTVAAMTLWEQGKFQLDDPVSKYIPEFKDIKVYVDGEGDNARFAAPRREMTVRDLMRHTSGLTYGNRGKTPVDVLYQKSNVLNRDEDLAAMMRKLSQLPLQCEPGSRFEYGVSTDVLGRLVEIWSGQPLDVFFAEKIFRPLDMRDTGFSVPAAEMGRFTTNYGYGPEKELKPIDEPQTSRYREQPAFLSGGGGLVSTGRDYMRFCQMLLNGGQLGDVRLLKSETVAMMTRNQVPDEALPIGVGNSRPGVGFGLGFAVRMERSETEPASRVGEYRWGGAASTHFWLSPADGLAVVVLQQRMPFTSLLEDAIKPVVYDAIKTGK